MKKVVAHQFEMFGYVKPSVKVPINAARIEEAKRLFAAGDTRGSVEIMRDVRYKLENYERRIGRSQATKNVI